MLRVLPGSVILLTYAAPHYPCRAKEVMGL